jgi:hypothetical protein
MEGVVGGMAERAGRSSEAGPVAGVLSVEDGGDVARPGVAWEAAGADADGVLAQAKEVDGDVGLVGMPQGARGSEGGGSSPTVELTARAVGASPVAGPAPLEFHEFHRDLYRLLRRDAQLDDEAAQTVVNHVALMGSSADGMERAVAELDGLVAGGLPKERVPAVRELLRRVAAEAF